MTTETSGAVINGQLQLDQPIALPNASRVKVTIELEANRSDDYLKNLDAWKQLAKQRPIGSGGVKFTREQLHERR